MTTAIPTVETPGPEIFDVELEHSLLEENARLARENRELLEHHSVVAVDFMGAIGSGKTSLIARLADMFNDKTGVAIFSGDVTTIPHVDALAGAGVPVVQISGANGSQLDANLVAKAIREIDLREIGFIFVEHLGSLFCPAAFPLGSKARVVVVSVTEGPCVIKKHPHLFFGADIVVINKIDISDVMSVSIDELTRDILTLKPDIKIIPMSCRTGDGLDEVASALLAI
jgi:hydrogenase nickel incorporation protein HypB